jgi:peptidoglycan/xylan/chitin deacetylase (PgdA/CDA1 family)
VRSLLVSFRIKDNHIRCRSASSSIIIVRKYLREIILNFHGIGEPPSHVPDEERPYWISIKYFSDVVRLARDCELEHRKVFITFDDGNKSDVTIALPLLNEFGRRASFFVLSERIGKPGFVDASDLVHLYKAGMTIGSHGKAHVDWTSLGKLELLSQVTDSLHTLSDLIGKSVKSVAVPFGKYDRRVLRDLRLLDIDTVYTSDGGSTAPHAWVKPRTTMRNDTALREIESIITGRLPPILRLKLLARTLRRSGL